MLCSVSFLAYVLYSRHGAASSSASAPVVSPSSSPSPVPWPHPTDPHADTEPYADTGPYADADPHLDLFTPPFDSSTPPFYHRATDTDREYPPVWVPVDSSIAKVLQDYRPASGGDDGMGGCFEVQQDGQLWRAPAALPQSQLPPDFADVFRGYQRLALLSLHLAFGRNHRILFVHKGNWSRLVPAMSKCAPGGNGQLLADTLDDTLRLDYVKSHILSEYGGYWFPPDALVVRSDLNQWVQQTVLPQARSDPSIPADTPMLVVGGIREVQHGNSTEWFKDDSVLFAEPRNPVMVALAGQMRKAVQHANTQVAYGTRNWFTKAMHIYSSPQAHPKLACSVVVLSPQSTGALDDMGAPVTTEQLLQQRPLDHLPHPDSFWMVVDTPDRRITSYPKYQWFAYMTEEAIVQSTLWISLLYRKAIGMDSHSAAGRPLGAPLGGSFRCTVSLSDQNHPLRSIWDKSWGDVGHGHRHGHCHGR